VAELRGGVRARAGIVVTGTEVLTGRVADRNGPWLSERLREIGVEHAYTLVVGDRRQDLDEALRFLADRGVDVILTTGGLGPTADDLTAEVVGAFAGRAMVLDTALEERIAEILRPLMSRWPDLDPDAVRVANRKQAVIPQGATILEPVGTAPGLVVPVDGRPTVVVLPGPPGELQEMWPAAVATDGFRVAVRTAEELRQETLRLFGIPESEIAETLRLAEDAHGLDGLEITT
jgi:nicotinamide-nucleotide amidase